MHSGVAHGVEAMSHVLLTGASGGIGSAVAVLLAQRGVRLSLQYHANRAAAEALRRTLPGAGHELLQADLADPVSIERLWQRAQAHGRMDALINNAGIFPNHPPLATGYADWLAAWQRTLAVNLAGAAHLSYFAARAMAEQGGGRIVNISSRAAFRGELTAPAYAASKAGLNAFSQSLAKALAARAVLVFVVAPGWVATARVAQAVADPSVLADQPLGRVATPQEVAQVVGFCALEAPASMTGAILDVNGASYLRS
jgi:3-oxoacyl-[acyl-carrier protein] reductase